MCKNLSCPVCIQNPALCSNSQTLLIPAALICSSSLRVCPSPLLIHTFPKHVVSPDKREEGENKRTGWVGGRTMREKKREREDRGKRTGLMLQFNYQPWLVSAVVGNYTTWLQETALLHPIREGTEGGTAACFPSLSCSPLLHLSLFSQDFPHFYQLTLLNRRVEYIK